MQPSDYFCRPQPPVPTDVTQVAIDAARKWGLTLGDRLPGSTCSLIQVATDASGAEFVLKAPFPEAEETLAFELCRQMASEKIGPMVIRSAEQLILLQRLVPGTNLHQAEIPELERARVAAGRCAAMSAIPPLASLIPLERWFHNLFAADDPQLIRAQRIAADLLGSSESACTLHGDLHHENILRHEDAWLIIDPKGLIGDPAFEPCSYLRNAPPDPALLSAAIHEFAVTLHVDPERIWGWAYAQTVLCELEDGGSPWDRMWPPAVTALESLRSTFGSRWLA